MSDLHREIFAEIAALAEGPLKYQMGQVLRSYDAKVAKAEGDQPIANPITDADEAIRHWLYDFRLDHGGMLSPSTCVKIAAKARELFAQAETKDTAMVHSIAKALEGVSEPGESLAETVQRLVERYLGAVAELQDVCEALDLQDGELAPEKVEWLWGRLAEVKEEREHLLNSNAELRDALQTARKEQDQVREANTTAIEGLRESLTERTQAIRYLDEARATLSHFNLRPGDRSTSAGTTKEVLLAALRYTVDLNPTADFASPESVYQGLQSMLASVVGTYRDFIKEALHGVEKAEEAAFNAKNLAADVGFRRGLDAAASAAEHAIDPISAHQSHDKRVARLCSGSEFADAQRLLCVEAIRSLGEAAGGKHA